MPTKRQRQFTAWSYSRKHDYDDCPLKASLKYLHKIMEPANKAMERGSDIHEKGEDYAVGKLRSRPPELDLFKDEFAALRKIRRHVQKEQELAVTRDWEPCGWFDREAWLRAKVDLGHPGKNPACYVAIDLKTGRVRPEHKAQLDLYAPVIFAHRPELEVVDAALWYLDEGEVVARSYLRSEATKLRRRWERETKKMMADKTFRPCAGRHCTWCWYGQAGEAKGGPGLCKF